MVDLNVSWAFTNGPHSREDKLKFWEELRNIKDGWSGPWCVVEDFNEILYTQERSTRSSSSNMIAEFHLIFC